MRKSLLILLLCAGCATAPSPAERAAQADALAAARGWQRLTLSVPPFALAAFVPPAAPAGTLTVVIEGDGLAWLSADRSSPDPTPRDPVGLQLALATPAPAAALARPCQYIATAACTDRRWWTRDRFAPAAVAATNAALDQLKARVHAQNLILAGYSGGGVLAALAAAQRTDVAELVTVASPLDTAAWTKLHSVDALTGTNPADLAARLAAIPQRHFAGTDDAIVPPAIVQSYAARFPPGAPLRVIVVPGFDHQCCWARDWPALIAR